jgi:hypothetical protein
VLRIGATVPKRKNPKSNNMFIREIISEGEVIQGNFPSPPSNDKFEIHAFTPVGAAKPESWVDDNIKDKYELSKKISELMGPPYNFKAENLKVMMNNTFIAMPEFGITNEGIDENFPIPPTNDKLLQKIRDWQIRGTATGDSELFSMCHNYLMDPDKPMAGKLEVIQKIDLAMDMDSSETPTEKDVYDYIRNSGVDMPFNSPVGENLRAWFGKGKKGGAGGGGWDRYNTKGERIGKCGDAKKGEGKPKCLSKSRAASLRAKGGKAAIGAAVSKKRRNDPNKNRKGKAKNVSNTTRKSKK